MTTCYTTFASDISRADPREFSSVEENEEFLRCLGVNQEMQQLGRGEYLANLAVRSYDGVEFFSDRFNVPLEMRLEPPPESVGILFPRTRSGRFLANGVDIGNNGILVLPPGACADLVVPALVGSDNIAISQDRFTELLQTLCPSLEGFDSSAILGGEPKATEHLRASIVSALTWYDGVDAEEALQYLLATLFLALEVRSSVGSDTRLAPVERAGIARLAEAYIHDNFRKKICIEDVCREAGVGVRSVQRAFSEYFDVTFTEYLRVVRLNALHRALRSANPVTASVAELALDVGFTHLGRMSVEFRRHFGRSPRDVLREQ